MQSPTIDPYTVSSIFLSLYQNDNKIGTATGFVWIVKGENYLISNWHVFSGRDPWSSQPKHRDGALPNRIYAYVHLKQKIGEARLMCIPLFDNKCNPLWKQHKDFGCKVDVAGIKLPSSVKFQHGSGKVFDGEYYPLNRFPFTDDMATSIGAEVFVIGFPFGLQKQGPFPIWKRGSIASEFALDIDGTPSFLIDTATREGMSGSPVLLRTRGGYLSEHSGTAFGLGIAHKFLGVYSGRYTGNLHEAHIGIVWKPSVVAELIESGVQGNPGFEGI